MTPNCVSRGARVKPYAVRLFHEIFLRGSVDAHPMQKPNIANAAVDLLLRWQLLDLSVVKVLTQTNST
jgi:hypothetical protein